MTDYNENKVYVIDDTFPTFLENFHEQEMTVYPMQFGHQTEGTYDYHFFGKSLFERGKDPNDVPTTVVNLKEAIKAICGGLDKDGKFDGIWRVHVNGQTAGMKAGPHTDVDGDKESWTAVYFVNDSDGDLQFYKSKTDLTPTECIPFKRGRLVMFPSVFCHEALPPTRPWRVTIGVCFHFRSILNK